MSGDEENDIPERTLRSIQRQIDREVTERVESSLETFLEDIRARIREEVHGLLPNLTEEFVTQM